MVRIKFKLNSNIKIVLNLGEWRLEQGSGRYVVGYINNNDNVDNNDNNSNNTNNNDNNNYDNN